MKKNEVSIRLKLLRKYFGESQTLFSEKLGIKQAHLSAMEIGHNNITIEVMKILSEDFNINLNWLISGRGKMFNEKDEKIKIDDIINILEDYKKQLQED